MMTDLRTSELDLGALRGIVLVTGTDTGVGKTVATAAVARQLRAAGTAVRVVKIVQSGLGVGEIGDAAEVARLSGLPAADCVEWARLPEPLAPTTAAARAGVVLAPMADVAARLIDELPPGGVLLAEGAGGLLVGLDSAGEGLLELADALRARQCPATFLIVTRAGLGTLNHTRLTCAALRARDHHITGLIIGSWPSTPDLAERCNLHDLPVITKVRLLGTLPEGIGRP